MITRRFDFDAFQKFKRKLDRKTATEIFVVEEDGQLVDLRRFAGRRFDYDGAPYAIAEYSDGSAAVLDLEDRPLFDSNGKPFDSTGKTQTHYIALFPSLATRNRIYVDDVPFFVSPAGLLEARASLVALRRRLRKYA